MNTNTGKKKKPVPCRFWMQGNCKYGDQCEYMHSMTPVNNPVQTSPTPSKSKVVVLDNSISPLLFGYGVVSFNSSHGLLFGSILPEDFFQQKETNFIKYLSRDLQILLRMPFNHFISHLICDENLKKTITSFFHYSPRVYDEKHATSPAAPIFLLLFRVYYRLVMDAEGQKDFAKISPPFGGFGKNYFEAIFNQHLISIETIVDWCSILGIKNKDVILQIVEKLQLNYSPFNDQIIGFFAATCKKMEECCNYLLDETVKSKQDDYYLFLKDILYNISFFIQCLPTSVYSLFDTVPSLLYHSEPKHIFSSVFDICKKDPSLRALILKCFDLFCEKMIYCYADPTLSATIPSLQDDSLQSTFFDYLRSHLDNDDSLDSCYIHEYARDRLSRLPGWDETQRAYFMDILSDSLDTNFEATLNKLTVKRERAKVEKQVISNNQFAMELLSEMFPNFGKAYIEAIIQYYQLQKQGDIEGELQKVVSIILNNQLPRELLNMNKSAKTIHELYNTNTTSSDEERRRVLESLFSKKELKKMDRMNEMSKNSNNEDSVTVDEKTKKSILAQYNRGLYEDEGVDDDYVDAVHNLNRELESDGEEEDEGGEKKESEKKVESEKVDETKEGEKKESEKKDDQKKNQKKETGQNNKNKPNTNNSQKKVDGEKNKQHEGDYRKNIMKNRQKQQKRRELGEKKRGLGK